MLRAARIVLTFAFGTLLFLGATVAITADMFSVDASFDLISCHVSTSDSVYGFSTWAWFPPGKVCHYPNGSAARPHWRGELVALVAIPLGATFAVWALLRFDELPRRHRHTADARAP